MKAAVYSGTRNLYPSMVTAAKSLLRNSSVEKIYFLIEDDEFPEWLPPQIETINVSGQKFFPKSGINFQTHFTYMSLLRVCYTKLFPDLGRILQLDVDTVVVDNIDPLWDTDLDNAWFAAVLEDYSSYKPYGPKYYNIGVAMFNLDKIRNDKADDRLIKFLNKTRAKYIDQDAWNRFGIGKDVTLPVRYNECIVTGYTDSPAIIHFAGYKEWATNPKVCRREYLKHYRDMTWEEVLHEDPDSSTNI